MVVDDMFLTPWCEFVSKSDNRGMNQTVTNGSTNGKNQTSSSRSMTYVNPTNLKNKVTSNLSEGLTFGTQNHSAFIPFTVKFLALALPGIALGHYLDQGVYWTQKRRLLGSTSLAYLSLQISAWVILFYALFQFAATYAAEFQSSVAGIFFVALFFTVQTNFVTNLQEVLGMIDKEL